MINVLLIVFVIVVYFFSKKKNNLFYVSMPSIVVIIYILWFIPQIYYVSIQERSLLFAAFVYSFFAGIVFLCLAAGFKKGLGSRLYSKGPVSSVNTQRGNHLSVYIVSIVAIVLNYLYILDINSYRDVSQWSGGGTIIAFLSSVRYVAFAYLGLSYLKTRRWDYFVLFSILCLLVLNIAFLELRRTDMISLMVAIILIYYFYKGELPSKVSIFLFAFVAFVFVLGISDLRNFQKYLVGVDGVSLNTTFASTVASIFSDEGIKSSIELAPDVRNGVYIVEYCLKYFSFGYGSEIWNDLIWQYVPAQFLGSNFKESLIIGERVSIYNDLAINLGYYRSPGSTRTGFGSAFYDLSIFAFFYFYLIGLILGQVFRRAYHGNLRCQSLYIALVPITLISFTHAHSYFLTLTPLLFVFSYLTVLGRRSNA